MSVRDLIKYSAVPAVIIDKYDLKIIHVNEKTAALSHWSRSELRGKFLSHFLSPVSGEPGDYQGVLYSRKGNEIQVHINIQEIVEQNHLMVSFWEVDSEGKLVLEHEVKAWRKAFEEHDSPVTIHAPNFELLDANQAACEAFGMTKEQLVGKKCYELFHGKDKPTVGCPMKALIESGHHATQIIDIESLNESAVVDCSPVFDKNGKLERIIHTAIDVESAIKMRKELARKKEILDHEEQYRAITQSSSDAIITMDIHRKIVGWNPGAQKMFGYLNDELRGKELDEIIPERYLKQHKEGFKNVVEGDKSHMIGKTFEVYGLRKDKTEFPAELSISNWEISSGKFFTATVRDISSRHQQEEALLLERNFSEAVLESLPGIFYLFTYPELRLVRWNKNHERLLGFSADELRNRHVTEWFSPKIKEELLNLMDEVIEKGYRRMDQFVITKDGSRIPCILTGDRLITKDKKYIMGVGIDISLRKDAEERLSKSEAQLRSLLNTIPDLVWLKGPNGVYLACNESFERYMNMTEEEIVGKTDFELIDSERANTFHELDEEAIAEGKSIFSEEWTVIDKDGTKAFVETVKTPMYDANGKFVGVLGIGHDMTHRKKAEAEIRTKNQELTRINAEKNKFFSIIAHDLRNPITNFMGLTQVMTEQLHDLTMEQLEKLSVSMKASAGNLFKLLENLLSWANMEQGLTPFKPETISLSLLANDVIEQSIQGPAKAKEIKLQNNISSQISVFADKNMIQTVIRNLLSNALKFTHKGGKIFLDTDDSTDGFVEIKIEDTGMGMNKDLLENLFVLNANINRPGTNGEPSTGLGLLLCKEFVNKHGGKIWAESEEEKGSVFHFTIPKK